MCPFGPENIFCSIALLILLSNLTFPFSFYHWVILGTSLEIQWLGLDASTSVAWVQSLVGELRSRKPPGMARKKKVISQVSSVKSIMRVKSIYGEDSLSKLMLTSEKLISTKFAWTECLRPSVF